MVIDASTNLGRVRLKIGDTSDLPFLPDSVIIQTLTDNNENVNRTVVTCAQYILAMLSYKTHQRLQMIEVWGQEAAKAYKDFILQVILNPNLNQSSPIPYTGASSTTTKNSLIAFTENWENSYVKPTNSEDLSNIASGNTV